MPRKNQQNSFIPEANSFSGGSQSGGRTRSGGSLFILFSLGLFIVTILLSAGLFIYKQTVKSNLADRQQQLEQARSGFDAALIDELDNLDNRISTTKELLNNHVAFTALFPIIESATLTNVTFNSMEVSLERGSGNGASESEDGGADTPQEGELSGEGGTDQESPETQPDEPERVTGSSLLSETQETGSGGSVTVNLSGVAPKYPTVALQSSELAEHDQINNPILSDFSLNSEGNVEFSVQFTIPEEEVLYTNTSLSSL